MMRFIYSRSPFFLSALALFAIALWGYLRAKTSDKQWERLNRLTAPLCLTGILFMAVFSRNTDRYTVSLRPFATITAARQQPELYRAMLMNMFLFFPLGLTLSNALPPKMSMWRRIALTTFLCCVISAGIEFAQCFLFLGVAETDDVICNTLGSFFGACSLLIAHLIQKWQNHSNR